mgnify:FL=1
MDPSPMNQPAAIFRPVIGIVCAENDPTPPGESRKNQAGVRYVEAVRSAGGLPLLIPLQYPTGEIERLTRLFDGILIIGGNDVDPKRYNGVPDPSVSAPNPERDALEIAIVRLAAEQDLPLFGICRGEQVMNIAMGGTLYTDLPSQFPTVLRHQQSDDTPVSKLTQRVRIDPASRLYAIVGAETIWTNTFHHQAVQRLGNGFRVAAAATDGVVEAIEIPERSFFIGVQWHPEGLQDHAEEARLFKAFVAAAAARAENREVEAK